MVNIRTGLMVFIIVVSVFICYTGTINSGFIWDDEFLVEKNPLIRAPIFSLQPFKQDIANTGFSQTIYYRPLQVLSYAVEYRIAGAYPPVFRIGNLILHASNSVLIFFLLMVLFRRRLLAFWTAVIFAVSPVHIGVVPYISARADLLMMFFGTIYFFAFFTLSEDSGTIKRILPLVMLVFAILSKESAIVLPFMCLLMDSIRIVGKRRRKFYEHVPYLLTALVAAGLHRLFIKGHYGSIISGPARVLIDYAHMVAEFIMMGVVPYGAGIRHVPDGISLTLIFFVLFCAIVLVAGYSNKERRTVIAFGASVFLVGLLPFALIADQFNVFSENWLYLPSMGLYLIVALVFSFLRGGEKGARSVMVTTALFGYIAYFIFLTVIRSGYWTADPRLSGKVLEHSAGDKVATYYKAIADLDSGKEAEAIAAMSRLAEDDPDDARIWYLKGRIELAAGNDTVAEKDFLRSAELAPDLADARFGLGLVSLKRDDPDTAIKYLNETLELAPGHNEGLLFLRTVHGMVGNKEEALTYAIKAADYDPYGYKVMVDLGSAYVAAGKVEAGLEMFLKAIRIYPERPGAYFGIGRLMFLSGNMQAAEKWVGKAIKTDPKYLPAIELYRLIREERD